eukprot:COSAG06_NODE_62130_length_266_cov_0.401198_1_plen_50_part_01
MSVFFFYIISDERCVGLRSVRRCGSGGSEPLKVNEAPLTSSLSPSSNTAG